MLQHVCCDVSVFLHLWRLLIGAVVLVFAEGSSWPLWESIRMGSGRVKQILPATDLELIQTWTRIFGKNCWTCFLWGVWWTSNPKSPIKMTIWSSSSDSRFLPPSSIRTHTFLLEGCFENPKLWFLLQRPQKWVPPKNSSLTEGLVYRAYRMGLEGSTSQTMRSCNLSLSAGGLLRCVASFQCFLVMQYQLFENP